MSLYKSSKSPYYSYDFQVDGRRFHGSTKARNKKDAEAIERQLKVQARVDLDAEKRTGNAPLTLDMAAGRWWTEVGKHHANAATTWTNLERLLARLGKDTRLDAITDAEVAALVAWRRGQTRQGLKKRKDGMPVPKLSNGTVNRSVLIPLKSLFTRAKRTWRYTFPLEPNWRDHWLKEAEERVRELDTAEGEALDGAVRDDYALWFEFARLTGLRHAETLIRWKDVNIFAKRITTTGKGGKSVSTRITPEVKAILDQCREHHDEWVFTYVARKARDGRERGKRYPITAEGAKTQWRRLRAKAGVTDFRFHDIRHDVGTKLLRLTGNLKLVQKALNHSSIKTTAKYAHVMDDEVGAALSKIARSRKKSQNKKEVGRT